tara:strand:- start:2045 stop:3430 length:1386 start_codon:yes stop_codon:yes gene_type:complete
MPSTYLHKNQGTPTLATKFTVSCWFKRGIVDTEQRLFQGYKDSNNRFYCKFNTDNTLMIFAATGGADKVNWKTTMRFFDTTAWYHLVVVGDSTEGSAGDRLKIYVNGVNVDNKGGFTKTTNSIDSSMDWGIQLAQTNQTFTISGEESHGQLFDGYITHFHYIDGTAYQASTFGETDATTGEWKIKTSPTLTMGNNGFTILKDGNTVTDQSSNSNDWAIGAGSLLDNKDNPSNNFCVINMNDRAEMANDPARTKIFNGNLYVSLASNIKSLLRGTIGVTAGKWYWEVKIEEKGKGFYGICNELALYDSNAPHDSSDKVGVYYYDNTPDFRYYSGAGELTTGIASVSNGDILGFALDMDNKALYIHKNGTYMNSGDPTSGASKTGAINTLFANPTVWADEGFVFPSMYCSSTSGAAAASFNFGNGYFRTTAVSSAQNPDDGIGVFEYDVPASYRAITTKGINA